MFEPHEHRDALLDELHARPRPQLDAPCFVTRLDIQLEPKDMASHCDRLTKVAGVPENARHASFTMDGVEVVFERRTEFATYTIFDPKASKDSFSDPPLAPELAEALDGLPGKLVSAIRLHLESSTDGAPDLPRCNSLFGHGTFAASTLRGGMASLASDFKPDAHGFIRFLVQTRLTTRRRAGGWCSAFWRWKRIAPPPCWPCRSPAPPAVSWTGWTSRWAKSPIASPRARMPLRTGIFFNDSPRLLARPKRLRATGDYRFAAARAYGDLVADRNRRLREERVEGHERVGVFIERRLNPALQTCRAVSERQHALAQRVDRAVRLLTTRVQVDLEDKNAGVLDAMNRRAAAQLRLQEAVETLSTVAITYYGVGLIHYLAKGGEEAGWPINPELVAGIATPVLFLGILFGLRGVRKWISRRGAS